MQKPVNHLAKVKDIFKKDGIGGVVKYCNQYLGERTIVSEKIAEIKQAQNKFDNELEILENGKATINKG